VADRQTAGAQAAKLDHVPFFSQVAGFKELWPEIARNIHEVMDRGKYSHGKLVGEFEQAIAAYTGIQHTIAVNSGTDALVLLLRAVGLQPGDEVVVPAFTFAATATSVCLARGRPLFADIEAETYTLDPASLDAVITPKTRAVMPVHLFCQMADMAAISSVAKKHDLILVEDSAEAIGMRWDGTHAGVLGAGGVLSFFPTKTLGALGDAGMILTNDRAVAQQASVLRHHGRMGKTIDHMAGISNLSGISGTNSKMDDLQAAILMAKLGRLDRDIALRADLAKAYTERLQGISGIRRLPTIAQRAADTNPVYYTYVVEVEGRDALADYLSGQGIGTEVYYPIPLHLQPCFRDMGHARGDFPRAEAACEHTVSLPFYPDLSYDLLERVCDAIRAFYSGSRS